jgi:hypothetical protein
MAAADQCGGFMAATRRRTPLAMMVSGLAHVVMLGVLAQTARQPPPPPELSPVNVLLIPPGAVAARRAKPVTQHHTEQPDVIRRRMAPSPGSSAIAPAAEASAAQPAANPAPDLFGAAFADGRGPSPPRPKPMPVSKPQCPPSPDGASTSSPDACEREARGIPPSGSGRGKKLDDFRNESRRNEAITKYRRLEANYPGMGCVILHRC